MTEQPLCPDMRVEFYDQPPERGWDHIPPVALVPHTSDIALEAAPGGMRIVEIDGIGRLVCPSQWCVHDPPRSHDGSDALYYVNGELMEDPATIQRHAVFVYTIGGADGTGRRARRATSRHIHTGHGMREDYYLLSGRPRVEGQQLRAYAQVPPLARHRVSNFCAEPALLVAVLRNVRAVPRDQWHTHLS